MTTAIQLIKKPKKTAFSGAQNEFHQLKKKIATLQQKSQKLQQELDECLLFYHRQIQPEKKTLLGVLEEFVKTLYRHYKELRSLSKEERDILKEFILDKISDIFNMAHFNDANPEICAIFEELEGVSYGEVASIEFDKMKEDLQEMFKERGIDIDFSSIEVTDEEPEAMMKMFAAMEAAMNGAEGNATFNKKEDPSIKLKNKKQLQQELQAQELKALQEKEIGSIYKQLAKVFHPDLEQDSQEKIKKEEFMKRLTSAYDNNDLHTLLLLQLEWMNHSCNEESKVEQQDSQLKIYNSILKDQVKILQETIDTALLHHKYLLIQPFLEGVTRNRLPTLCAIPSELRTQSYALKAIIRDLHGTKVRETIQDILQSYSFHLGSIQIDTIQEVFAKQGK